MSKRLLELGVDLLFDEILEVMRHGQIKGHQAFFGNDFERDGVLAAQDIIYPPGHTRCGEIITECSHAITKAAIVELADSGLKTINIIEDMKDPLVLNSIAEDGTVVTNNHVVENASTVEISTDDGKTYSAKVIGTDPKIKFARLREQVRQKKMLDRYIAILNKHGDDSKQDKKFILKLTQKGDGDVLGLCNVAKVAREIARKESGTKCRYPHSSSEVCIICRPRQKKPGKRSK